jgi:hypothetical protein
MLWQGVYMDSVEVGVHEEKHFFVIFKYLILLNSSLLHE